MGHTRIIRKVVETEKHKPKAIVGIDPSLRGHAMALIAEDKVRAAVGWTEKKTLQRRCTDTLCWYKMKGNTPSNKQHRCSLLAKWTLANLTPLAVAGYDVYVSMEGYAFSKRSQGLSDIHELCGAIKLGLWHANVPLRIYDPTSVKLAWTGNGHADKDEMRDACTKLFGMNFDKEGSAGEDLADAVLIAALLHTELEIRDGRLVLEELGADMRRVMLRTTKAEPEALITRPFIHRCEADVVEPVLGGRKTDTRRLGPGFGTIA